MNALRRTILGLFVGALAACERSSKSNTTDTTSRVAPAVPAESASAAGRAAGWDASAGPVLLVPAEAPNRAFIIVPDSAASQSVLSNIPRSASVTLFGHNGSIQSAELPNVGDAS